MTFLSKSAYFRRRATIWLRRNNRCLGVNTVRQFTVVVQNDCWIVWPDECTETYEIHNRTHQSITVIAIYREVNNERNWTDRTCNAIQYSPIFLWDFDFLPDCQDQARDRSFHQFRDKKSKRGSKCYSWHEVCEKFLVSFSDVVLGQKSQSILKRN